MDQSRFYKPYISTFPTFSKSTSSDDNLLADVTQVFQVTWEECKFNQSDNFIEGQSIRTYEAIMEETHTHIEMYSSEENKSLTFIINGKPTKVLVARHRILAAFKTEPSKRISIPKELQYRILDKQRQQIKELEANTATKINFPSDDVESNIVTITGTKNGIEEVEYKIKIISDELNLGEAFDKISVPKIYHPFICGPRNENLNAIVAKTGANINIPPHSVQTDEITITGKTQCVAAAKKTITNIYTDMKMRCKTMSLKVPKLQHKFLADYQNSVITEILELTGVNVEIPLMVSLTDTITLRGSRKKLAEAAEKVNKIAMSRNTPSVKAPFWIHKYIIGHEGANIKKIIDDLPEVTIEFNVNENKIKIEGPSKKVKKAQKKLDATVRDLIVRLSHFEGTTNPKYIKYYFTMWNDIANRLNDETDIIINVFMNESTNKISLEGNEAGMKKAMKNIHRFTWARKILITEEFHEFVIGRGSADIRKISEKTGTYIHLSPENESSGIIVIFGNNDNIEVASDMIEKIDDKLKNIVTEKVSLPPQFYNSLTYEDYILIRSMINDCGVIQINFPPAHSKSCTITMRGPKDSVQKARQKILEKKNEKMLTRTKIQIIEAVISIDSKHYYFFVEDDFFNVISELCGGIEISFPRETSNSNRVTLKGPSSCVKDAEEFIQEILQDLEEFDIFMNDMEQEENISGRSSDKRYNSVNNRRVVITAQRVQWGRKRKRAQSIMYY